MTNNKQQIINRLREKGQSLVEVALFLPVFLVLIAGVVEVSNILVTQNSVHNATRVGTRFGSNGGQDEGMALSVQNAVTNVLKLESELWDMWTIRGKVNKAGNDFEDWEFVHIYGDQQTQVFTDVVEADIKEQVLERLQTDENGNSPTGIAGEIAFVGMYIGHDIDSILGMDALEQFAGVNSVRSLSVMRKNGVEDVVTDACTAFPIAVDENIRSVLPPGQTGANSWRDDFSFPSPDPNYYSFVNHVPNEPFLAAREGYLFNIQNGASSGGKGWLAWNQCDKPSNNDLIESLSWPGNSNDYAPSGGKCVVDGEQMDKFPGFMEAGDNTDKSMHVGDWIAVNTGNNNSDGVRSTMQDHVDVGRTLRVVVYNPNDGIGASGGNASYHITRFAIMRMIGYSLNNGGGESFILAEFVDWDESCGQDLASTP